jgi:hypothetical protein
LHPTQVVNVTPRYAKLLDSSGEVFGWENMELISGEGEGVLGAGVCARHPLHHGRCCITV